MDFEGILTHLPSTDFSFAYGSGVFEQRGYENVKEAPMIDMVLATSNATQWHQDNLQRNRAHYSILGALGPAALTRIQEDFGAGLYYNTLVRIPDGVRGAKAGQKMKYGVISTHTLVDDLVNWRSMYISGRMHKPVRILSCTDPTILAASRENLRHAVRTALLLLPATFSAEQLFTTITALSYMGDFRMVFGENPHKVANIVSASMSHFYALYMPVLQASFPTVTAIEGYRTLQQEDATGFRASSSVVQRRSRDSQPRDTAIPHPADAADGMGGHSTWAAGPDAALPRLFRQDVSPEARLALGMALPYNLQKRMAAAQLQAAASPGLLRGGLQGRRWLWAAGSGEHLGLGDTQATDLSNALVGGVALGNSPADRVGSSSPDAARRLPVRARAVEFAEAGREVMQRARLQRLQWLVARRERREARVSAAKLASALPGGLRIAPDIDIAPAAHVGPAAGHAFLSASLRNAALRMLEYRRARRGVSSGDETFSGSLASAAGDAAPRAAATATDDTEGSTSAASGQERHRREEVKNLLDDETQLAQLSFARARSDPQVVAFWDRLLQQGALTRPSIPASAAGAAFMSVSQVPPAVATTPPPFASEASSQRGIRTDVAVLVRPHLRSGVAHLVGASARSQSVKGILTAGPVKAALYAYQKVRKFVAAVTKRK